MYIYTAAMFNHPMGFNVSYLNTYSTCPNHADFLRDISQGCLIDVTCYDIDRKIKGDNCSVKLSISEPPNETKLLHEVMAHTKPAPKGNWKHDIYQSVYTHIT